MNGAARPGQRPTKRHGLKHRCSTSAEIRIAARAISTYLALAPDDMVASTDMRNKASASLSQCQYELQRPGDTIYAQRTRGEYDCALDRIYHSDTPAYDKRTYAHRSNKQWQHAHTHINTMKNHHDLHRRHRLQKLHFQLKQKRSWPTSKTI